MDPYQLKQPLALEAGTEVFLLLDLLGAVRTA